MPRVLIIPHCHHEGALSTLCEHSNEVQTDFRFHLLPPDANPNSPLRSTAIDYSHAFKYLGEQKALMNREPSDLMLAIYDGTLEARAKGLTNLFLAASSITEPLPCNAIASLQFIRWHILAERFNYDLQNHALFHLVICALIGSYTTLHEHEDGFGCLLDFNNRLQDFNQKLLVGYYLCSSAEKGCHDRMIQQRYGQSIIRLCETLRSGINRKQFQVHIKEINLMEAKYKITGGQQGAVGDGATTSYFNQVWTTSGAQINLPQLATELGALRSALGAHVKHESHQTAVNEVALAEESARAGDGTRVLAHLKKAGAWFWDVATKIGIGVATAAAKTALGL